MRPKVILLSLAICALAAFGGVLVGLHQDTPVALAR
jgi:hypothetical protein